MVSPLAGSGADPWSGPGFGTAPDATNDGRVAETALRRGVQALGFMIPRRHREAVRFIRILCWRSIGARRRSVSSTSIRGNGSDKHGHRGNGSDKHGHRGNGSDKHGQRFLRILSRCTAVDQVLGRLSSKNINRISVPQFSRRNQTRKTTHE
jgi:hypothetical protein